MSEIKKADTRRKQLTKLWQISNDIIKQFGFIYFLKIALSELRTQKFSLFSPDESPYYISDTSSSKDHYQEWLVNNILTKKELSDFKLQIESFSYLPQIELVLVLQKFSKNKIKLFLDSLQNQLYTKWNLNIYVPENLFSEITSEIPQGESRIKILKTSTHNHRIKLNSKGDFIAFISNDIVLYPSTLYFVAKQLNKNQETDLIYSDFDRIDEKEKRSEPFFKPDWSPHLLLSMNYFWPFFLVRKKILDQVDFSNEYDLLLKLTEKTENIIHIQNPILSVFDSNIGVENEENSLALQNAIARRKLNAKLEPGIFKNSFKIKYMLSNEPKVSIIIPTRDQKKLLKRCLTSLEKKTDYKNYEIIIIDNNSEKEDTITYLESLSYTIIKYESPFNFSKMNNLAASHATGEFLLFLNDDVAALKSDWLHEMVSICSQQNVGAVGPKLIFKDDTIQHAGIVFLKTGAGFHPFQRSPSKYVGNYGVANVIRDYSAVTAACLLTRKKFFEQVGGFDEQFDLYYGDSDLCLKIKNLGMNIVYTPFVILLHDGSSKIKEFSSEFFAVENHYSFIKKWPKLRNGDPFYNPNLGWNYEVDANNKIKNTR